MHDHEDFILQWIILIFVFSAQNAGKLDQSPYINEAKLLTYAC